MDKGNFLLRCRLVSYPPEFYFLRLSDNEGGHVILASGTWLWEGLDPGEIPPTKVRKKWIATYSILSVVNLKDSRKI